MVILLSDDNKNSQQEDVARGVNNYRFCQNRGIIAVFGCAMPRLILHDNLWKMLAHFSSAKLGKFCGGIG